MRKGDWLLLPLAGLTTITLYMIASSLSGLGYLIESPESVFNQPILFALLMGVFSVAFIYKTLRRSARPLVSKVTAYTLSIILLLTLAWIVLGTESCTGLYGVQTDCTSVYYFKLGVILFNPYVGSILGALSLAGTTALTVSRKER